MERLAAYFLNTYVAEYVGNVVTEQLTIGWLGESVSNCSPREAVLEHSRVVVGVHQLENYSLVLSFILHLQGT